MQPPLAPVSILLLQWFIIPRKSQPFGTFHFNLESLVVTLPILTGVLMEGKTPEPMEAIRESAKTDVLAEIDSCNLPDGDRDQSTPFWIIAPPSRNRVTV